MVIDEFFSILQLFGGEFGWLGTAIILLYEIALPNKIGPIDLWDTKLQIIFNRLEEKMDNIMTTQTAHIQVTRALARRTDGVSEEIVDNYLHKNGIEVSEFLEDRPMEEDNDYRKRD